MNPHVFREYDIRGKVATDLTPDFLRALGRALGSHLADSGGRRVGVGMDVRESSPMLADALVQGIVDTGLDVVRLGVVPTPVVYFAAHHLGLDGAAQVTGSHNPISDNGIKLMRGTASLFGIELQSLRERMEAGDFIRGRGSVTDVDVTADYLDAASRGGPLPRPLRVVLDAGNGCAWDLGPRLLTRIGASVDALYATPDGRFPNHMPDPTLPETLVDLQRRVVETGADLGVAMDGDADRLGVIDETGAILWGDDLLALFARDILTRQPGATVLLEVKCSQGVIEDIAAHGGVPVMTRTGHSIIKREMRERGALLAGEMSGHLFFAEGWFGFDDALYAAARMARLLAASPVPLSALRASLPRYHATPETRLPCADDRKFDVVAAVLARYQGRYPVITVDGARVQFPEGWGLVRASNTEPALVLRAEGKTPEARDAIRADLGRTLRDLGVPA